MIYAKIDVFETYERVGDRLFLKKHDFDSNKSEFSLEEFELLQERASEGKILNLFGDSKKIERLEKKFVEFLKIKMDLSDEDINMRSAVGKKFVAHEFTIISFLAENDFIPISETFFYKK